MPSSPTSRACGSFDVTSLLKPSVYNIPLIEFLLVSIILFSAMLSAMMIRVTDGGHKANTFMHFVIMSWIGAIIAIMTKWLVTQFLAI